MGAKPNFKLHLSVAPAPFFFNSPNIAFEGNNQNEHLPSIIERRLTDLGDKYFLMFVAFNKTLSLAKSVGEKYDKIENELKVGEDYWELVLFLNHFLFEARSVLDIVAIILRHLHGKATPQSFNEIEETGKHAKVFSGDQIFYDSLVVAKSAPWIHYLLSRSGKTSLRDRAAHYTVARINVFPHNSGNELVFRISADMRARHPMQANTGLALVETVVAIMEGMDKLLCGFKENYTQKRIRVLLGSDPNALGLFVDPTENKI